MRYCLFLSLFIIVFQFVIVADGSAQDTTHIATDTIKNKNHKPFRLLPEQHSAKIAGFASAVIPGLGQAYNKKYWKIPIVYAGLATAGYFIYYNYTVYSNFRKAYALQIDSDSTTSLESFDIWYITNTQPVFLNGLDPSGLQSVQDTYRGYLDLSVIIAFGVYALNIVDAVVDGQLYDFDIGDDLSLNVKPFVVPGINQRAKEGLTLSLTF